MTHFSRCFLLLCSALVFGLLPLSAAAHTGHAHFMSFSAGFGHPFGGIDHLLAMVAVGIWAAQIGGRALWVAPLSFVAAMLLGGLLGVWTLPLPLVEPAILASVLILGLVVALAYRASVMLSGAIVAVFAIFHGFAHGAEMPGAAASVAYSLGFIAATALLHGVGLVIGVGLQRARLAQAARVAGVAIMCGGAYLAITSL